MKNLKKVAIGFGFSLLLITSLQAAPKLHSGVISATAGYFQLRWESDAGEAFILEEASSPSFENSTVIYEGPDTATLISGRSDGIYYYRIRDMQQKVAWSKTVSVNVTHHSLSRALIFFTLGALVFIATLTIVVLGNQKQHLSGE